MNFIQVYQYQLRQRRQNLGRMDLAMELSGGWISARLTQNGLLTVCKVEQLHGKLSSASMEEAI